MIEVGSTMTLEAWDAKYKPNLTWNHAWGAAPANISRVHPGRPPPRTGLQQNPHGPATGPAELRARQSAHAQRAGGGQRPTHRSFFQGGGGDPALGPPPGLSYPPKTDKFLWMAAPSPWERRREAASTGTLLMAFKPAGTRWRLFRGGRHLSGPACRRCRLRRGRRSIGVVILPHQRLAARRKLLLQVPLPGIQGAMRGRREDCPRLKPRGCAAGKERRSNRQRKRRKEGVRNGHADLQRQKLDKNCSLVGNFGIALSSASMACTGSRLARSRRSSPTFRAVFDAQQKLFLPRARRRQVDRRPASAVRRVFCESTSSMLPVPLNSWKINSSIRLPVSIRAEAMMVRLAAVFDIAGGRRTWSAAPAWPAHRCRRTWCGPKLPTQWLNARPTRVIESRITMTCCAELHQPLGRAQ